VTAAVELARQVASDFFAAMSARDLPRLQTLLAPDFVMTVSGNQRFSRLEDFFAHSRARQGAVRKHVEGFDVGVDGDSAVVYSFGTMSGTWLDGSAFQGVRFIDRFGLQHGLISTLDVFSDMAEFRPGA
jgi:ketosteroid isomerase-like protein